jgi:hypothetical protein
MAIHERLGGRDKSPSAWNDDAYRHRHNSSILLFHRNSVLPLGMDFFWELATLIDVMLLGHWIEAKSVMGASMALEELVRISRIFTAKTSSFCLGDSFWRSEE